MAFQPAYAETGAANASEFGITPLTLTEYNPLKVKNAGPEKAKGIVYFINGLDSSDRTRDDYHAVYPYIYGLNQHYGWDVIAAKFPNAEKYSFRAIPRSSDYVKARLKEFRKQGYKRVILAGQSWGAWVSVDFGKREGAEKVADALLLTAPANYGTREWNGAPNPSFILNKTEYLENIKTIRIPTVATFFEDDEFDPGGRGPATRDTFTKNHVAALVIDRPANFTGHGAGWLPAFDYFYGACINSFLEHPKDGNCKPEALPSPADVRSAQAEKDVVASGGILISLQDLKDKTFIVTSPRGHVTVEQYGADGAKVLSDSSLYSTQLAGKGDRICFGNACSRIYRLKDGGLIGFGSDGNWTSRMVSAD